MQIHEHYICPNQAHIYITFVPANTKRNKSKSGQVFFCLAHVLLGALNLENEPSRAIDRRYNRRQTTQETIISIARVQTVISIQLVIIHPRISCATFA